MAEANFQPKANYLADAVYGAIDGTVTTFAVVSGVAGADLGSSIVLILGTAGLVGDGFSMAVGNYLGIRAERERYEQALRSERESIERRPQEERDEVRRIYADKGFEGPALDQAVAIITADRDRWLRSMMTDELHLMPDPRSPLAAATTTMVSFLAAGSVPLAPFVMALFGRDAVFGDNEAVAFTLSSIMTLATFFGIGALKSRFVDRPWFRSGIETLLLGGAAATLAYVIGDQLRDLVD